LALDLSQTATPPRAGDESRSDRLVAVYNEQWQRVFRLCMSLLRNESDAEDAAQETFARAVERIDGVYGEVGAYLMTVARHICYRELTRRARRGGELDPELCTDATPADLQAAERSLLLKVWALLSPRHKTILAHSFAGYSYDEIASITGLSVSAVTSKLWRARQRARELAEGAASVILIPAAAWRHARERLMRLRTSLRVRGLDDPSLPTFLAGIQQVALVGTAVVVVAGAGAPAIAAQHPAPAAALAGVKLHTPAPGRGDLTALVGATGATTRSGGAATKATTEPPQETNWHTDSTLQSRLGGVTAPGAQANPQDANITWVGSTSGSPTTGFLSGFVANNCTGSCQVLFRTDDGGRTWTKVNSTSFPGGEVLVPPSFPTVQTIFAVSNPALERSDDGGLTFRKVAPAMAAALDPTSPAGDLRVVVLAPQPMVYHALTGALDPGPALPAGAAAPTAVLVSPRGAVLVGADQAAATPGRFETVVERCTGASCTPVFTVPELGVRLLSSSTAGSDHVVYAFSPSHVYLSRDDGTSFAPLDPLTLPPSVAWVSVITDATCPATCVFVAGLSGTSADNRLSSDGGASFHSLPALAPLVHGSSFLGDGHLLAALSLGDAHGLGVRCSADLGRSWATYC
jgi:RNA polymerase sigma-70 factor (ECF subfamily)